MSNKKKIIIAISISLVVIIFGAVYLYNLKKQVEEKIPDTHNYAQNDVADKTTEDNDYNEDYDEDEEVEPTTHSEVTTEEEAKAVFNTQTDANAESDQLDTYNPDNITSTVSIDGKLITFPCSYQTLKDTFGELKIFTIVGYENIDTATSSDATLNKSNILTVYATPTTGEGTIAFTLVAKSENETNLEDKICIGGTFGNETYLEDVKLMTIALENNISFGATADEIRAVYGRNSGNSYKNKDNDPYYTITYDKKNYKLVFTGSRDSAGVKRLFNVSIEMKTY